MHVNGRKVRVSLHPDLLAEELEAGAEVVLNESMNVVMARDPSSSGEVVTLKEVLSDEMRALVTGRGDEERIVDLGDHLKEQTLRPETVCSLTSEPTWFWNGYHDRR